MEYPTLYVKQKSRQMVDTFNGYNHNLRIGDGEFYDMKNMTSDYYPVLAPRRGRQETVFADMDSSGTIGGGANGLIAMDNRLWFTQGSDLLASGHIYELGLSPATEDKPKQLIAMGSYIIIMPDKKYINIQNPTGDYGDIEATFKSKTDVKFELCSITGENYSNATVAATAPASPKNMDMWIDTSTKPHTLKKYSSSSEMWVSIATTYVKISATGIGKEFSQYDGVTISGITADGVTGLNGSAVLWGCGEDYIIVVGILDKVTTQTTGAVTVEREMPAMDYVFESGNRLWGCRYGYTNGNGAVVNEIYASKLGDFKNWNCYMGLSTDSYTASCGTDGPFTGAIAYLGYPLFFKENCVHKVYGNYPANYQIQVTTCRGVQKDSYKSLAIVNGTLFYKSNSAVCAFDGSLPVEVSYALGNDVYSNAVGGAHGNKYYISMRDQEENWHLFVYDVAKGLWHKEDDFHAESFCSIHNQFHGIDYDTGRIISMLGEHKPLLTYEPYATRGVPDQVSEDAVEWMVESGDIGLSSPDMKYISRMNVRMSLAIDANAEFYIQYDMDGQWNHICTMTGTSLRSFSVPIRPKRCDHMRLKIVGKGEAKIYSITKTIEQGSEIS